MGFKTDGANITSNKVKTIQKKKISLFIWCKYMISESHFKI